MIEKQSDRPAQLARQWPADAKARLSVDRVVKRLDALTSGCRGVTPRVSWLN